MCVRTVDDRGNDHGDGPHLSGWKRRPTVNDHGTIDAGSAPMLSSDIRRRPGYSCHLPPPPLFLPSLSLLSYLSLAILSH